MDNHAAPTRQHLQQHIQQHGPISFADYMQHALYTPGLGYYQTRTQIVGADGDFITAPSLSPLFGQCIANQAAQVLATLGEGAVILEFGPGHGKLARDTLLHLDSHNLPLPKHYWLLDVSANLREIQQRTLAELPQALQDRVQWLGHLPNESFKGMVIANEVLDAMPVHQFTWQDGQLHERCVGWQDNQLCWQLHEPSEALADAITALNIDWPDHYQSEISLLTEGWLASLNDCWQTGVTLLIDYGFPRAEYYHPSRSQGTVMCHSQQQSHADPLRNPGLDDITSHVDFTHVATCAAGQDNQVLGYTSQAYFLFNCGLMDLINADDLQANQQVKMLTLPHEMGELFKVMAIGKQWPDEPLRGFQQWDQRHRL